MCNNKYANITLSYIMLDWENNLKSNNLFIKKSSQGSYSTATIAQILTRTLQSRSDFLHFTDAETEVPRS